MSISPNDMSTDEFIHNIVEPAVNNVRASLANSHHTETFDGLCDVATGLLETEISMMTREFYIQPVFLIMHGELKHTPKINSKDWPRQHTMAMIYYNQAIYVDCTSGQFKFLYPGMPDYIISTNRPGWFYWDSANPMFWFDSPVWFQLVSFLQYEIWGRISDFIRKIKGRD